jgi:hypothetical protein
MPFYVLYREVFTLDGSNRVIQRIWPVVREQVLDLSRLWGEGARDFFDLAVDSHFAWRQNAGILTVYRLYIPIVGGEEQGLMGKLDDAAWVRDNALLVSFLGFDMVEKDRVAGLLERLEQSASSLT